MKNRKPLKASEYGSFSLVLPLLRMLLDVTDCYDITDVTGVTVVTEGL